MMSVIVKALRFLFVLCLVVMFLLGVAIVVGQIGALVTLTGSFARDIGKLLQPYAIIFASITGLIGYILSYFEKKKK